MSEDNQGWICPKCKKVLAPSVKACKKCNQNESVDTDNRKLLLET